MLRRVLLQPVSQKLTQRNRVRTPPRNAPLRADPFQIPHQQHPEIHPGRNARPPSFLRIELAARLLRELVETVRFQQLVQSTVEGVAQCANLARRHEQLLLPPLAPLA